MQVTKTIISDATRPSLPPSDPRRVRGSGALGGPRWGIRGISPRSAPGSRPVSRGSVRLRRTAPSDATLPPRGPPPARGLPGIWGGATAGQRPSHGAPRPGVAGPAPRPGVAASGDLGGPHARAPPPPPTRIRGRGPARGRREPTPPTPPAPTPAGDGRGRPAPRGPPSARGLQPPVAPRHLGPLRRPAPRRGREGLRPRRPGLLLAQPPRPLVCHPLHVCHPHLPEGLHPGAPVPPTDPPAPAPPVPRGPSRAAVGPRPGTSPGPTRTPAARAARRRRRTSTCSCGSRRTRGRAGRRRRW